MKNGKLFGCVQYDIIDIDVHGSNRVNNAKFRLIVNNISLYQIDKGVQ